MQAAFITVNDVFELSPILARVSPFPPKHMLVGTLASYITYWL